MQRVFEEAAFSLGVGEMSGLVASDSGEFSFFPFFFFLFLYFFLF